MRISDWSSDVCSSDLLLMDISDLIVPASVIPNLRVTSKKQALQELAKKAAELTGHPATARDPEVPHLVNEHEHRQDDEEGNDVVEQERHGWHVSERRRSRQPRSARTARAPRNAPPPPPPTTK